MFPRLPVSVLDTFLIDALQSTLKFPEVCEEDVSDAAKDLIRNLLCDEDERLDVARIRSHSFFAEINFETLLNSKNHIRISSTHWNDFACTCVVNSQYSK